MSVTIRYRTTLYFYKTCSLDSITNYEPCTSSWVLLHQQLIPSPLPEDSVLFIVLTRWTPAAHRAELRQLTLLRRNLLLDFLGLLAEVRTFFLHPWWHPSCPTLCRDMSWIITTWVIGRVFACVFWMFTRPKGFWLMLLFLLLLC